MLTFSDKWNIDKYCNKAEGVIAVRPDLLKNPEVLAKVDALRKAEEDLDEWLKQQMEIDEEGCFK